MPKFIVGGIAEGNSVESFLKKLEKADHSFDIHIIAYLDFLGMKDRILGEEGFDALQIIRYLLFDINHVAKEISKINGLWQLSSWLHICR